MLKIFLVVLIIISVLLVLIILESLRELASLKVTSYDIEAPGITEDKTYVFLSDYHEAMKLNSKIISAIERVSPDAVLIGGDMVNGRTPGEMIPSAVSLLNDISKKFPVYYSLGNHEKKLIEGVYHDPSIWDSYKKALDPAITFLLNENIELDDNVRLYGLDAPMEYYGRGKFPNLTKEKMDELLGNCSKEDFVILLGHAPDFAEGYAGWGADLTLSGHFHGGMVRLPFFGGVVSPRIKFFPKYDYGLYNVGVNANSEQKKNQKLLVTNGVGQHSIKLRLFNTPEIVQVNLKELKDK